MRTCLLIAALLLAGCTTSVPEIPPEAPITIFAPAPCPDYLPGTDLGRIPIFEGMEETLRKAYVANLTVFDEPCLVPEPGGPTEMFRFLWMRTFDPPVVVRFERWPDGVYTVAKVLDERAQLEPPTRSRGSAAIAFAPRRLAPREEAEFVEALAMSSFWSRSSESGKGWGHDGAIWIFEGWNRGRYHAIEVWSPLRTESARVGELGIVMLRLAGVRIDPKRIY